jgi:hypothetical protein
VKHWAEDWLRERRAYNVRHACSPRESALIDRMLTPENRAELRRVYDDIAAKVPYPTHRLVILGALLDTLYFADSEQIQEAKRALKRIEDINFEMFELLEKLADLHAERADLANRHAITTPDDAQVSTWAELGLQHADGRTRALAESWTLPDLRRLQSFDSKYWPKAHDMLRALAQVQIAPESAPRLLDPQTSAALDGHTKGHRAIIRAIWAAIADTAGHCFRTDASDEESPSEPVPSFTLTDRSIAALASLVTDETVTEDNVKRARQKLSTV